MTKHISGIGVMFVLIIIYLTISIINKFNYLDLTYFIIYNLLLALDFIYSQEN